ncbi:MAG: anthranilate phosphoribosyltransferase, partial [Acidimicrobiia bacterium]|nr:anthranilate phosphoribosyltransferase [Acidimicrobiia bacterium]
MPDTFAGWPKVLGRLTDGADLDADMAQAALGQVLAGEATDAQIAAFIVALRQKGETVPELTGMVRAMLDAAAPLDLPAGTIDIVGAGGAPARRQHALNVSTMACLVAAGAGAVVCKHGNRRASSTSGSFDLLEALGIGFEHSPEQLGALVADIGIGFAFARTFHPAMRHAAPVRAELGIPTVFNILGPLSHPGRVTRQVIGVSDPEMGELMVRVLRANGSERAIVVTGHDGLDEFSLTGPSQVFDLDAGAISEHTVAPEDVGLSTCGPADLVGGDPTDNAAIAEAIVAGTETGPRRDIVLLN